MRKLVKTFEFWGHLPRRPLCRGPPERPHVAAAASGVARLTIMEAVQAASMPFRRKAVRNVGK